MTQDMYNLLKQIEEETKPAGKKKLNEAEARGGDPRKIAKKLFLQLFNETTIAKHIPVSDELGVSEDLIKPVEKIINDYQKQVMVFIKSLK